MHEIKAYIRAQMVDAVIDALSNQGVVSGLAVTTLRTYGHGEGDGPLERVEMCKLEADVADAHIDEVVDCIREHARTGPGHAGDGKIYVSRVRRAIRIADGRED